MVAKATAKRHKKAGAKNGNGHRGHGNSPRGTGDGEQSSNARLEGASLTLGRLDTSADDDELDVEQWAILAIAVVGYLASQSAFDVKSSQPISGVADAMCQSVNRIMDAVRNLCSERFAVLTEIVGGHVELWLGDRQQGLNLAERYHEQGTRSVETYSRMIG